MADGVALIFGAASVQTKPPSGCFTTPEATREVFEALKRNNIAAIDTAQLYGDSETLLGLSDVASTGL